jgi:hypothetical protein
MGGSGVDNKDDEMRDAELVERPLINQREEIGQSDRDDEMTDVELVEAPLMNRPEERGEGDQDYERMGSLWRI